MKNRLIIFLTFVSFCFFLSVQISMAQCPATPDPLLTSFQEGSFEVSARSIPVTKLCMGDNITIQDLSGGANINYIYEYKAGDAILSNSTKTASNNHLYTTAGKYSVIQLGSKNGQIMYKCQELEVIPNAQPDFSIKICSDNQVSLTINNNITNVFDQYAINWGDGNNSYMKVGESIIYNYATGGAKSFRVNGILGYGCVGAAKNQTVTVNSTKVALPVMKSIEALSNQSLKIIFDAEGGSDISQQITGLGGFIAVGKSTLTGENISTITSLDTQNKGYCFKITTTESFCGIPYSSDTLCSLPFRADAQGKQIMLNWAVYPYPEKFEKYSITRNGSPLKTFLTATTSNYPDNDVMCGVTYFYQLTATVSGKTFISKLESATPLANAINNPFLQSVVVADKSSLATYFGTNPSLETQLWQKIDNGIFTLYKTIPKQVGASITEKITNLDTRNKTYCYKTVIVDPVCGTSIASDSICSIPLSVIAQNRRNEISWKAYPYSGVMQNLTLSRNGNIFKTLPIVTTNYTDADIQCKQEYCYNVLTNLGNTKYTESEKICVTALSDPNLPKVTDALVTLKNDKAELAWFAPNNVPIVSFDVLRAENSTGSAFVPVANTVKAQIYSDPTADPTARSYCYQLRYQDVCGTVSPVSDKFCTVFVSEKDGKLSWTSESPFLKPVNDYEIHVFDNKLGTAINLINNGSQTDYIPDLSLPTLPLEIRYRITANATDGTTESISNAIVLKIEQKVKLYLPDIFTPNNDGFNDVFEAKGRYLNNFQLSIFNRWGEIIFLSNDKAIGWDGSYNSEKMPDGIYIYKVTATDNDGKLIEKNGNLYLLR